MGTDYKCGCRNSMGHWFLCKGHNQILCMELEPYEEETEEK